jgi:hypothetical protein
MKVLFMMIDKQKQQEADSISIISMFNLEYFFNILYLQKREREKAAFVLEIILEWPLFEGRK